MTKKQMKNHWDGAKGEWKIWYRLKSQETGLGWDYDKNTVTADNDWWKNYLESYPEAAKFRDKGLDHSDQLTALFKDGVATGNMAWAPSQGTLPEDSIGACQFQEDTLDSQAETTMRREEDPILHDGEESRPTDDDIRDTNDTNRRRRSGDLIPPPQKPQKVSVAANMNKFLDRICVTLESRAAETTCCTIKDCIDLLNQMPEVPRGSELYLFACRTFEKKEKREIFVALGDSDLRMTWLENEQTVNNRPNP